jgi:hypothetical protein
LIRAVLRHSVGAAREDKKKRAVSGPPGELLGSRTGGCDRARAFLNKHIVPCSAASGHAGEVAPTVVIERLGLDDSGQGRVVIRRPIYVQARCRIFPAEFANNGQISR